MRIIWLTALLVLAACKGDGGEKATPPAQPAPSAPAPLKIAGTIVTLNNFAQLRFLEGAWQGDLPNGGSFYEVYHFVNDSTIQMHGYKDAALKVKGDSATTAFRDGHIVVLGSQRWVVVKIDSAGYHFIPEDGSPGVFSWKAAPGGWIANVGGGRVYNMKPIKPSK